MQNTNLFSEQNKELVRSFFNHVKECLRKNVHGSFHSQILNNDSTNAMPLLHIKTPDENLRSLRIYLRSNNFEYQKIISTTDEDRKHKGFMQVTLKNPAENLALLSSFTKVAEIKDAPIVAITENEAQEMIASFRKLIKATGGKNGHVKNETSCGHFDSINLYNKRTADGRPIAAIYHGTRHTQAERTLELLLNVFDFEVELADKQPSIILITLNRGIDYASLTRGKMHKYFPDYEVILAEQKASENVDGDEKIVAPVVQSHFKKLQTRDEVVVHENTVVITESNLVEESAFMKMAVMSFEQLSGAEKVLFLNKYGASLVPNENEILSKYYDKFKLQYAGEFERNLRATMADEIHDEVSHNEAARLEPILKNQLRPIVIAQCKDENKKDMERVLSGILSTDYLIVKQGGTLKIASSANGKLVLEGTVSAGELVKKITEVVK